MKNHPPHDIRADRQVNLELRGVQLQLATTWGLFSPERLDEGSRLLLETVEVGESDRILDLGCGYGPLGLALAKLAPQGSVELVDKDFVAVEYSIRNAKANGISNARAYLSNGFEQVEGREFDRIVSNVPAKVSGELILIWLEDAYARLAPSGRIVVVVVTGLKDYFKRHLLAQFGNVDKLKQGRQHVVLEARK